MKTSCIVLVYNGQTFIEEQLKSILAQTIQIDEIVVIDDFSTDCSSLIVENLMKSNNSIRLIKNHINLGVINSIFVGIKNVTGDYIFLSDQDDIWVDNKVEIFREYFLRFPKLKLFYSDGDITDVNLNRITTLSRHFYKNFSEAASKRVINSLMMANFIPGATMAIEMEFANMLVPFPEINYVLHDGWFAIVAHLMDCSLYIPQKLIYYRRHNKTYTDIFDDASLMKRIFRSFNYSNLEIYFGNLGDSFLSISNLLQNTKHYEVDVFRNYYESLQTKKSKKVLWCLHLKSVYKITILLIKRRSLIFLSKLLLFELLSFARNLFKSNSTSY